MGNPRPRPIHFTAGGRWVNDKTRYVSLISAGYPVCAGLYVEFDGTIDCAKVTCKRCLTFMRVWRREDLRP